MPNFLAGACIDGHTLSGHGEIEHAVDQKWSGLDAAAETGDIGIHDVVDPLHLQSRHSRN